MEEKPICKNCKEPVNYVRDNGMCSDCERRGAEYGPFWTPGWTGRDGKRIAIDGTPFDGDA